ncbi:MAG: class I SAM-dependent methyltransferase [Nannocystales bacterium]
MTAVAVATARGLALTPDATAAALLPFPLGPALSHWQALPAWARSVRLAPRVASAGLVDHLDLRTRAIDRELEDAVRSGARTMVILGAGFDGRAYRLPCLREVDVFEVDHPDTSSSKQARAAGLPSVARSLQHVAVDFDEMSVNDALEEHGHDASVPTVWIWEGVTPYLPLEATEITLRAIARRSAPSSRLLMTYAVPKLVGRSAPRLEAIVRQGFAWLGEPLRGAMTPQDAARRVRRHGFESIRDTGQREWAGPRKLAFHLARPLRAERLLVSASA